MRMLGKVLAVSMMLTPVALFAQNGENRGENQHDRIQQGVRSGELTRREAHTLNRQERGIHQEARGMRAEDNGHLTRGDRRLLDHQRNVESRRIYAKKHNERERAYAR